MGAWGFMLLVLLIGCQKSNDVSFVSAEKPDSSRVMPSHEIENFSVTETKNGQRRYVANAKFAAIYKENSEVITVEITVNFYDENQVPYTTLTADSGYIDEKTKDMRAVGHVVVVTKDNARLETESLQWQHATSLIISDDFVKITRGRDVLTGIGLKSDMRLEKFEIKKDMKAYVIDVDEDKL